MSIWQLQPEEIVAQHYRVEQALGPRRYRVKSLRDSSVLVLTLLELSDPQAVSEFEDAAANLCRVRHPALASYVDHGFVERADGYWGLLFQEHAAGVRLSEWIQSGAAPSEDRVVQFAEQILDGLACLHEQTPALLHGQLCPDYVFIDNTAGPKLVCFGDVERFEGGAQLRGAVGFAAPEETRGQKAPTSDLYAFGGLLVYLLARRSPAELTLPDGTINLSSLKLSNWLSPILERLLQADPGKRFPSARSVKLALKRKATPLSLKRMLVLAVALSCFVALPAVGVTWYFARAEAQREKPAPIGDTTLPPRLPPSGALVTSQRVYVGHIGVISNLAWLPDSVHFVSAGYDGAIKLWHRDHEEPLRSFSGQRGEVQSLAVDPQGNMLAAGGKDGQLRIWSIETGQVTQSIPDSPGGIHDLEFSQDGKLLASTGVDGFARIHDPATGKEVRSFPLGSPGLAVAFSPDGKLFATTASGPDITVWDRDSGVQQCKLTHGSKVSDLKFTADGAGLISAGDDKRIVVWNMVARDLRHVIRVHRDEVWRIALSEKGNLLATGGKDHLLVVSDPFKGQALESTFGGSVGFPALAYSPDGQYLVGGGAQQKIWLYHAEKSTWFPKPVLTKPPPAKFTPSTGASKARALAEEGIFVLREQADHQGVPKAIKLLEQAEELDENDVRVLELASRVAQQTAYQHDDVYEPAGLVRARALIDKATRLAPRDPDVWRRVAYVAFAQKKLDDAVAATEKARALDPGSLWQKRCELELAKAQHADRERRFVLARALLEDDPTDEYGLAAMLKIFQERGEWDAAEAVFKSQLVLDPGSAWLAGRFADFYTRRRKPQQALDMARRALAIMDYGVGHRVLGDAFLEEAHQELRDGKPRDRVVHLVDSAAKEGATASHVFFLRGLLAWTAGDFAKAHDFFKQAVERDSRYKEAQDALAWKP
ncbi:MAG: hypothetical protein AB7S68_02345 [Polyangiaceae bacterium]